MAGLAGSNRKVENLYEERTILKSLPFEHSHRLFNARHPFFSERLLHRVKEDIGSVVQIPARVASLEYQTIMGQDDERWGATLI